MADQKISDMTSATDFNDADVFPLVQTGTNKKGAWSLFKSVLKTYFDTLYGPIASPTFTGTVTTPAAILSSETASRVAIIDASKNIKSADTATYPSLTELAYVKGVTSAIQTQLDAKAASSGSKTFAFACSDESTLLSAGAAKITLRMPYAMTVTEVRASLVTAQTSGSIFTVDINESGVSILSTKITIDNTEKTSVTATTPAVISDASLADDAELTVDIDQIGDGTAKGLKITLIGY